MQCYTWSSNATLKSILQRLCTTGYVKKNNKGVKIVGRIITCEGHVIFGENNKLCTVFKAMITPALAKYSLNNNTASTATSTSDVKRHLTGSHL